jgi:hypothetical protein
MQASVTTKAMEGLLLDRGHVYRLRPQFEASRRGLRLTVITVTMLEESALSFGGSHPFAKNAKGWGTGMAWRCAMIAVTKL